MRVNTKVNNHRFIILGAGLAGLSVAIHLKKAGYQTTIIEKEPTAGGLFTNSSLLGCDFDYGPKILLLDESENSNKILKYLKNNYVKLPVAESAYLKQYGLLHFPLQRHLIDLPPLVREEIIQDLKSTIESKPTYSNFKEWLIAHYGKKFSEMVLIPYEEKKWQIDLSKMDFRWALKRPVKVDIDEVIAGAKILLPPKKWYYYPKSGNISTFTEKLIEEAGEILTDHAVIGIDLSNKLVKTSQGDISYDTLISTLPLDDISDFTPELPKYLQKNSQKYLKRLSITIFNLVFKGNHKLEGTAIYFPEKDFIFRRISVLENLCPALARKGLTPISVEVSINPNEHIDEHKLLERVLSDLKLIPQFAQLETLLASEIRKVDFAYPLQIRGHSYHVGELHRFFASKDVYHCGRGGNYDYCNGDEAFLQGSLIAQRAIKNLEISTKKDISFSVTVGLPSYKSGQSIINTVNSILKSKCDHRIQVVVSVDGPTLDKTIEKKLISLGVFIIHNDERQGQTARNAQITNCTSTDILIMTQDDVIFEEDAIQKIVDAFKKDSSLTMVAPLVYPLPPVTRFEQYLLPGVHISKTIATGWNHGDNYLSSIGRCLAYRTETAKQFDVDEKIINCDAFYYFENKRIGGKFKFLDSARVYYRLAQNLSDHLKQVRKFVVSKTEMDNYMKMDLNTEYTYPPKLFRVALFNQFISEPLNTIIYLAISIYARSRPKSYYQEVTRFWDIDKSTKNT